MAKRKYLSNYSIENIAQSIARDSEVGKRYGSEDKKRLYQERIRLVENYPELLKILSLDHIRSCAMSWAKRIARVALVPPEIVVVDSRIQDMCSLPFWTYYGAGEGSFGRCAGVGAFSCCPPFNLPVEKVRMKLDKADVFLVLQTSLGLMMSGGDPGAQFQVLNRLAEDIDALMGKGTVVQKFGGGPCFACYPESCEGGGACRTPHLKVPSLEGMGICVDQLCKDLVLLTGDSDWKITWIKGFGTPNQKPKKMKATGGLALSLKAKGETA
jgi:hypothetical protein